MEDNTFSAEFKQTPSWLVQLALIKCSVDKKSENLNNLVQVVAELTSKLAELTIEHNKMKEQSPELESNLHTSALETQLDELVERVYDLWFRGL